MRHWANMRNEIYICALRRKWRANGRVFWRHIASECECLGLRPIFHFRSYFVIGRRDSHCGCLKGRMTEWALALGITAPGIQP